MRQHTERISYFLHPYLRPNAPRVKVLSPPRSGSNWLEKLLYKNFNVVVPSSYELCWKHNFPDVNINATKVIIIRSPYPWIVSFYDWERIHGRLDKKIDIHEFAHLVTHQPDLLKYLGPLTPVEYWNTFLKLAVSQADSSLLVSHNHLADKTEQVIKKLFLQTNWKRCKKNVAHFPIKADWWEKPNILPPLTKQEKKLLLKNIQGKDIGFDLKRWNKFNELSGWCLPPSFKDGE